MIQSDSETYSPQSKGQTINPSPNTSKDSSLDFSDIPISIRSSRFTNHQGVEEIHWVIRPTQYATFETQLKWIELAYQRVLENHNLTAASAIWRRFLCSDLINQEETLNKHAFSSFESPDSPCAVSWVGQAPAMPSKVTLWAYHINDPSAKLDKKLILSPLSTTEEKSTQHAKNTFHTLGLKRGSLTHYWSTGMIHPNRDSSYRQTQKIFSDYLSFLEQHNMRLANHVIRTWFFVQNVDSNYAGLVQARNEIFDDHNLTADSHYIASTGIEGVYTSPNTKILLDSYAIAGIMPEQISYLQARDHLSPTNLYGVAFERGTAVAYRDRTHLFISGTASINKIGETIHCNDVIQQLNRTLENIQALLQEKNATLDDLQIIIVYLRDTCDQGIIRKHIIDHFPHTPFEIVTAPVCRPNWLIEIEGLAIIRSDNPTFPAF